MFFPVHDQNNEPVKIVPYVSYAIIALCILVFLYQKLLMEGDATAMTYLKFLYTHAMVPKAYLEGNSNYTVMILKVIPVSIKSNWLWLELMPVSSLFMHASVMHIVGNMWFFWIFSDNVEERFGPFTFLLFYLITGAFSSLGYTLYRGSVDTPLLGASGAVSSVMGAYLIFFPKNRITTYFCPIWFFIRRIDVSSIIVTGMYFLTNLLSMAETKNVAVAFEAHISGFGLGLLVAYLYNILVPAKK